MESFVLSGKAKTVFRLLEIKAQRARKAEEEEKFLLLRGKTVICPHAKECENDDCMHSKPHDPQDTNCFKLESMCLYRTCKCVPYEGE